MKISLVDGNTQCDEKDIDFNGLKGLICASNWSPSTYHEQYRRKANFRQSELLALDFDEGFSLDEAVRVFQPYKHIIGTSRNHRKMKQGKIEDRYRVVLFLDNPVYKSEHFERTWRKLADQFPQVDAQASDASRMFYPCTEIISASETGSLISVVYEEATQTVRTEANNFSGSKGQLSIRTQKFLETGQFEDSWHLDRNLAGKDMKAQGYSIEEARALLTAITGIWDRKDEDQLLYQFKNNSFEMDYRPVPKKKLSKNEYFIQCTAMMEHLYRDRFHILEDEKGNRRLLEDDGTGQVRNVNMNAAVSAFLREVYETEMYSSHDTIRSAVRTWMETGTPISEEPATVAFKNTQCLTYHRLEFEPEPGDCPTFASMISPLSNKDALCAYIWSLLEPESYAQQLIWWHGLGGDGKSSLARILQWIFGNSYVGTSYQDYKANPSFYMSSIVGKRVAVFNDENNNRLLMNAFIKQMSGGDCVTINPKMEPPYTARLNCKLFIFSNKEPEFNNSPAHLRRLIYCHPLEKREYRVDPKFEEKLKNELPQILHLCKEMYDKLAPEHRPIECDMDFAEFIGDQMDLDKQVFFEDHIDLDPAGYVLAKDLQLHFKRNNLDAYTYKDFLHFMKIKYGIDRSRPNKPANKKPVYLGIKLKRT